MNHVAQQADRPILVLRRIAWFLGGLVVSAALVVVIPPLDLFLLLALMVASIVVRVRDGRFDPRLTGMLLGVLTFSIYALVWALTIGISGISTGASSGFGLGGLFLPVA